MRTSAHPRQHGFTLIELLVTLTILSVLALVALPLAEVTATRSKEQDLRRALRQIRSALDQYKNASDLGQIPKAPGQSGYPTGLELLTQPVGGSSQANGVQQLPLIFLRDLPRDPFCDDAALDAATTWSVRSYASPPDDPQAGADVFDVHSRSTRIGTNGVPYSKW